MWTKHGDVDFNSNTWKKQVDLYEFESSLVYITSSRPPKAKFWDPT